MNRVGNFRFPYLGKFGFLLTVYLNLAFQNRRMREDHGEDRHINESSGCLVEDFSTRYSICSNSLFDWRFSGS